jgi:Iron-containing redox enzyme
VELPQACGPVSRGVVDILGGRRASYPLSLGDGSVTVDRDAQLALWTLYELSYGGFAGVDPRREWDLDLIALRICLEDRFERELRAATRGRVAEELAAGGHVGDMVLRMAEDDRGPRLSSYLRREATATQMRDFLRERSVQQLKESDPQAFLVPRLRGRAKVAMAELQYDEFGGGRPEGLHQLLYAESLAAVGLDREYGAYIDDVSAVSLASANVMSLFALNRRLTAAGVGHFAAFEACSSVPSRRIAAGLERLGLAAATPYFDEHVEADAVHEQIAARDICGAVVDDEPGLLPEVLFGAACTLYLDELFADEILGRWQEAAEGPGEPDDTVEASRLGALGGLSEVAS